MGPNQVTTLECICTSQADIDVSCCCHASVHEAIVSINPVSMRDEDHNVVYPNKRVSNGNLNAHKE